MTHEEHKRFHEDGVVEDALHIIVERELAGEEALDSFWAKVNDIVQAQTLTTKELK